MKIAIIAGSHRKSSQSERVARYIEREYAGKGTKTFLFSLAENPLPLWDEGVWSGDEKWKKVWSPIATELGSCSGLVVVSPEWSGMVPPGLKNFFLLCSAAEVGHKPALIVAVSASGGGAYPVNELRISSYKNTRLCYIPEHVIIRNVESMLVGDTPANSHDAHIRARLSYGTKLLTQYAAALDQVRASGVINHEEFPHGM